MNTSTETTFTSILPIDLIVMGVIVSSINLILALPTNGYVLWLMLTGTGGTMASGFFALNLAVSEIFFSLSGIWHFIYAHLYSVFYLKAYLFSLGLVFTARPLFQSCICVEHYLAVVHPVLFLRCKPLRNRVTCCSVAWLVVLGSCMYSLRVYVKPLYQYGYFVQNLLLLTVMLFCGLSVLWALKKPGPGDGDGERRREGNDMKRRAFKIIVLIILSMLLNYLLYLVVIPLQCCLTFMEFNLAFAIASSLALTTGFVQPFLFLHRAGKLPCIKAL